MGWKTLWKRVDECVERAVEVGKNVASRGLDMIGGEREETRFRFIPFSAPDQVLTADWRTEKLFLAGPEANEDPSQRFIIKQEDTVKYIRQDHGGQFFLQAMNDDTVGLSCKELHGLSWSAFTGWAVVTDGWRLIESTQEWQGIDSNASNSTSLKWSSVCNKEFLVTVERCNSAGMYMSSHTNDAGSIPLARADPGHLDDMDDATRHVRWIMRPVGAGYSAEQVPSLVGRVVSRSVMGRRPGTVASSSRQRASSSSAGGPGSGPGSDARSGPAGGAAAAEGPQPAEGTPSAHEIGEEMLKSFKANMMSQAMNTIRPAANQAATKAKIYAERAFLVLACCSVGWAVINPSSWVGRIGCGVALVVLGKVLMRPNSR